MMYEGIEGTFVRHKRQSDAWAEWLDGDFSTTHLVLAVTVVFKGSGQKPNLARWSRLYQNKFLWKLNKVIFRRGERQPIFGDYFAYEFTEKSKYKTIGDGRNPHHIHGVICVPHVHEAKIWDEEVGGVTQRVQKDISSVKEISTFDIQKRRGDSWCAYTRYMTKGKQFLFH
jgi:hypothetical protein